MISIQDFFISQQPKPLSQKDKSLIYKKFIEKRERNHNRRRSVVYKSFAYSISSLAIIGFVFFGNMFHVFDLFPSQISQQVSAQSIGKIISSQGEISIYDTNNRKIDTDTIQLADRVVVGQNSKVVVLINESFTAEISGPAQFQIIVDDQGDSTNYRIKLLNWWDYIAVNSIAPVENNRISVQTSEWVTIQKSKSTPSDKVSFEIKNISNTAKTTIINKSSSTLEVLPSLEPVSLLQKITNSIDSSSIVINPEQIVELSTQQNTWIQGEIKLLSQQAIVITDMTKDSNTLPKKPISSSIVVKQEVEPKEPSITKENMQEISSNLYKTFLQKDYNELILYYFQWKENEYNIITNNINNRLNRIANSIHIQQNTNTSLDGLISFAQTLQNNMSNNDQIPHFYYRNLAIFIKKLSLLQPHTFGMMKQPSKTKQITIDYIYWLVDLQQNNTSYQFY